MNRREFNGTAAGLLASTGIGGAATADDQPSVIPALRPRDESGHHFVLYSDCCSGTPGTALAANLQAVNAMVARIDPQPEFIAFPGDAIAGYTQDYKELRRQWDYWRGTEMKWVDQRNLPLYQSTSNHNTYDDGSEAVFREVHPDLPQNGPDGQRGLAYWFRRGNLLYVSTHQPDRRMPIDHAWLDDVLRANVDAKFKFVAGHYPVFPVNGYIAWPLWCFPPKQRRPFWDVLVKHDVDAYLASHIIAFDVQAHDGVLQILSGGAGTEYGPGGFMPGRSEYFHAVQIAIDQQGLQYQVHDPTGLVREKLNWPLRLPVVDQWQIVGSQDIDSFLNPIDMSRDPVGFRIRGTIPDLSRRGPDQTLLCAVDSGEGVEPVWIGIDGDRLVVRIVPVTGHGWQTWTGPRLTENATFDWQLAIHPHMGPGGILLRPDASHAWSTLETTSSKGVESLKRPRRWAIGHGQSGTDDRQFTGESSTVAFARNEPTS